jgi:hypothetical protein
MNRPFLITPPDSSRDWRKDAALRPTDKPQPEERGPIEDHAARRADGGRALRPATLAVWLNLGAVPRGR